MVEGVTLGVLEKLAERVGVTETGDCVLVLVGVIEGVRLDEGVCEVLGVRVRDAESLRLDVSERDFVEERVAVAVLVLLLVLVLVGVIEEVSEAGEFTPPPHMSLSLYVHVIVQRGGQ